MRRIAMAGIGVAVLAAAAVPDAIAGGTPFLVTMNVYYDADHDGARDDGEEPIQGYRFFLDSDADEAQDAGEPAFLTNADGQFSRAFNTADTQRFRPSLDLAQTPGLQGLDCTQPTPDCVRAVATMPGGGGITLAFGFWRSGDDDGDRFSEPQDCDDTAKGIRPGALEIPGNQVDENCDAVAPEVPGLSSSYDFFESGAIVIRQLNVTDVYPNGEIKLSCNGRGCGFERPHTFRFPNGDPRVRLGGLFERRKLKPGTVITVVVSAPDTLGVLERTTVRKNRLPKGEFGCVEPGSTEPGPCPFF